MKLKNISLLYPIKAPWSANYSEFLDPREGYEIIATGGWMRIMHHGRTVMVVNDCMVRCAEVVDEPMVERQRIDSAGVVTMAAPEPVKTLDVMVPEQAKVIEQMVPQPVVKRRGRPPKIR